MVHSAARLSRTFVLTNVCSSPDHESDRTAVEDIDRASEFYSEMGLLFTKHRHGTDRNTTHPVIDGFVFEIYPLGKHPPTIGTRIGFSVDDVDSIVSMLLDVGAELLSEPGQQRMGRRAVVKDLDGTCRRIADAAESGQDCEIRQDINWRDHCYSFRWHESR